MTRGEVQDQIYNIMTEFPSASSDEVYTKLGEWLDGLDLASDNFSQEFMKVQILSDFGSYELVKSDGIVEEEVLPE